MNLLSCTADRLFAALHRAKYFFLSTEAAEEWNFMEGGAKDGVFKSLIESVEGIGASGYSLLMTIGIIGLVFSIIFTAVSLLMTSNAQKKEEKKGHALIICIAGICIFSVFSIIGFFKSIGSDI